MSLKMQVEQENFSQRVSVSLSLRKHFEAIGSRKLHHKPTIAILLDGIDLAQDAEYSSVIIGSGGARGKNQRIVLESVRLN